MNTICCKYNTSCIKKQNKKLSDSFDYAKVPPILITHNPFIDALQTSTLSHPRHEATQQQQSFWRTEQKYCYPKLTESACFHKCLSSFFQYPMFHRNFCICICGEKVKVSRKEGKRQHQNKEIPLFMFKEKKKKELNLTHLL